MLLRALMSRVALTKVRPDQGQTGHCLGRTSLVGEPPRAHIGAGAGMCVQRDASGDEQLAVGDEATLGDDPFDGQPDSQSALTTATDAGNSMQIGSSNTPVTASPGLEIRIRNMGGLPVRHVNLA